MLTWGGAVKVFTGRELKGYSKYAEYFNELSDDDSFYFFNRGKEEELRRCLENVLLRVASFRDRVARHVNSWSGLYLKERHARIDVLLGSSRVIIIPSFVEALKQLNTGAIISLTEKRNEYIHVGSPDFEIKENDKGAREVWAKSNQNIFKPVHTRTIDIASDLVKAGTQMETIVKLLRDGILEFRRGKKLFG